MSGNQPFPKPGSGKAGKLTTTFPQDTCRVCRNTPTGREKASPRRHLPSTYRVILQPLTMQGSQTLTLTQLLWLAIRASELLDSTAKFGPISFVLSVARDASQTHSTGLQVSHVPAEMLKQPCIHFREITETGTGKNSFCLSVTDSPWEDDNLCVFVDRTSRWYDGPQERLMSFCNYYRRSAQEKL